MGLPGGREAYAASRRLKHVLQDCMTADTPLSHALVLDAIREGAALRVRTKPSMAAMILADLVPIVWGSGTGSKVMIRIADAYAGRHGGDAALVAVHRAGGVMAAAPAAARGACSLI